MSDEQKRQLAAAYWQESMVACAQFEFVAATRLLEECYALIQETGEDPIFCLPTMERLYRVPR